ncbi:MAG TPA: endonuclease MutS2 [Caldithrix abyssi]|uniref:Endonuclease MutS2 n=1 Tax=Caldithrix abyssi TaxID=187145 RepID=A0A7V5VFX5_CALAY|nr:endonuclease MutS2 [Caldithrix abyssi]
MFGYATASAALNFNKLLYKIAGFTHSDTARQRVLDSAPVMEASELNREIERISALQAMVESKRAPLRDYEDIRPLLKKIEPLESFLEIKECLAVSAFLEIVSDMRQYFKSFGEEFPEMSAYGLELRGAPALLSQLQYTIEPGGAIYDNASRELKQIRRKLHQLQEGVHKRLKAISSKNQEHLQEDYITLREGRLVLPVRAFSVSKISGIVHGQSSSGGTKYVEPMAVVELNNEIQELLIAERKEIIKILKRLAALMREQAAVLREDFRLLVTLDSAHARVRYARSYKGVFPNMEEEFGWDIRQGFHPLLLERLQKETVPLNLRIGYDYNELIISGPNAGGKTVAMKTVGMLQLMYQCAIPMPVDPSSSFPICRQMFVVIGDKQSIDNDLSTFSSHIRSLKTVLDHVDHRALVLIDEIGIGTEPAGGAALAIAILQRLNRRGIVTIVSTHQNQLKIFASENDGVENGAMQYDVDALRPLFILSTGIPGSSFTFDIGKRFGLPDEIIQKARALYGDKQNRVEEMLTDITRKSADFHEALRRASLRESELSALTKLYKQKVERWEKEKKKMEKEAREEARLLVEEANRRIEATIRAIRESSADKEKVRRARRELEDFKEKTASTLPEKKKPVVDPSTLHVGDRVRSRSYGITGQVSRLFSNKREVELERKGLKLRLAIDDLEKLNDDGRVEETVTESATSALGAGLPNRLDLRGLDSSDALSELEIYMDSILHSSWKEVTIVHGKGTGALRQAVQTRLKKYKGIRFRTGRYGEGDTGVTIVTLNEGHE